MKTREAMNLVWKPWQNAMFIMAMSICVTAAMVLFILWCARPTNVEAQKPVIDTVYMDCTQFPKPAIWCVKDQFTAFKHYLPDSTVVFSVAENNLWLVYHVKKLSQCVWDSDKKYIKERVEPSKINK